jgi:hypothetical protein
MWKRSILQAMLTGFCALAFTLLVWVLIVTLLDRRFRGYENLLWAGSLWLSAVSCTMLVACARSTVRVSTFGCTLAFAVFAIIYMACEGPIFGDVAHGGDPGTTMVVVWNLATLPFGVFVAADIGASLGNRRRRRRQATPTAA